MKVIRYCRTCKLSAICLPKEGVEGNKGPYGSFAGVYRVVAVAFGRGQHFTHRTTTGLMAYIDWDGKP